MVRIYDIPDHTFESDEDESSSDEDDDSESEGMPSWITGSAISVFINHLLWQLTSVCFSVSLLNSV